MKLEEARTLSAVQRQRIANLIEIADAKNIRVDLSEDGRRVRFYGKAGGNLICTSPVTDFDE